jgi:hypothetical protein
MAAAVANAARASDVQEVLGLIEQIRPLFVGRRPEIVGAVLADLLAMLLAGHVVPGDPKATAALREELLQVHLQQMRPLIPLNEKHPSHE